MGFQHIECTLLVVHFCVYTYEVYIPVDDGVYSVAMVTAAGG